MRWAGGRGRSLGNSSPSPSLCGIPPCSSYHKSRRYSRKERATIAYCRVSSQAQKPDLQHQQAVLEKFCKQQAIEADERVIEIGGGLHFERKQFLRLVDRIVTAEVERVVLAHQDRLERFGCKLLGHLCLTHQLAL